MSIEETQEDRPRRGRPPRQEAETGHRRRRKGVLDVMGQSRLNPFDDGMLDHESYVYRWVNDEAGRLRSLTIRDDYDHVRASDLDGFDASQTDSESDGPIRLIVGESGGKPLYAYLCRKPRDLWEDDRMEMSDFYESIMEGRIYEGAATESDEQRPGGNDKFYAPKTNQIGSVSGTRRRGPVPRSLK